MLIGSIIAIRRKSFQLPQSVSFSNQPRAILPPPPALWLVLLFDTVMLIVLNFTHV